MLTTFALPPRLTPLRTVLLALPLSLLAIGARAQTMPAEMAPKIQDNTTCTKELSKFEQTLALLRQTQGAKAAADIRERLLPAKVESEIVAKEGSCGLARHLRKKKLID